MSRGRTDGGETAYFGFRRVVRSGRWRRTAQAGCRREEETPSPPSPEVAIFSVFLVVGLEFSIFGLTLASLDGFIAVWPLAFSKLMGGNLVFSHEL